MTTPAFSSIPSFAPLVSLGPAVRTTYSPRSAPPDEGLCGEKGIYDPIREADHTLMERIRLETGLPLYVPLGESNLQFVTSLDEDPTGKVSLGSGNSGLFCLGIERITGEIVGLKVSRDPVKAVAEHALQSTLGTTVPHLLKALDLVQNPPVQVIEVAGLGTLDDIGGMIHGISDPTLRQEIFSYIAQYLLEALAAMHLQGASHLDLKPNNVMIDHKGNVKLIDLDQSVQGPVKVMSTNGAHNYFPPERLIDGDYDESSTLPGDLLDAWSLGLTLWELVCDEREVIDYWALFRGPLTRNKPEEVVHYFKERLNMDRFPEGPLKRVVGRLLETDPKKRWSPQAVLGDQPFQVDAGRAREHLAQFVAESLTPFRSSPCRFPRFSQRDYVRRPQIEGAVPMSLHESRQAVLSGAPGMGKSSIARFLVDSQALQDRYGTNRFWISSEGEYPVTCDRYMEIVEQQLRVLAKERGVLAEGLSFPRLQRALAADLGPSLYVFDGAAGQEGLADLELPGAHFLVTTTEMDWEPRISVGAMQPAESANLVDRLIGSDPDKRQLTDHLEHVPLSIAQAAAAVQNHSKTVASWLEAPDYDADERQWGHRKLPYSINAMYQRTLDGIAARVRCRAHQLCCVHEELNDALLDAFGVTPVHRKVLFHSGLIDNNGRMAPLVRHFIHQSMTPEEKSCAVGAVFEHLGSKHRPEGLSAKHGERLLSFSKGMEVNQEHRRAVALWVSREWLASQSTDDLVSSLAGSESGSPDSGGNS